MWVAKMIHQQRFWWPFPLFLLHHIKKEARCALSKFASFFETLSQGGKKDSFYRSSGFLFSGANTLNVNKIFPLPCLVVRQVLSVMKLLGRPYFKFKRSFLVFEPKMLPFLVLFLSFFKMLPFLVLFLSFFEFFV